MFAYYMLVTDVVVSHLRQDAVEHDDFDVRRSLRRDACSSPSRSGRAAETWFIRHDVHIQSAPRATDVDARGDGHPVRAFYRAESWVSLGGRLHIYSLFFFCFVISVLYICMHVEGLWLPSRTTR